MAGKIRKLFSNLDIQTAVATSKSVKGAAKKLSKLRGTTVTPQLLNYWVLHLDTKKKNGEPYQGTTVLDRGIRADMELRVPKPEDDNGDIKFVDNTCILIIPDQHAPYNHPDAIQFLIDVAARIRPTRVINLGDETDGHALSFHDSDPNLDGAGAELAKARIFVQELARVFPSMDVAHSNHGSLIYRRAFKSGLPVEYIKSYRDILFPNGGGDGWSWKDKIKAILPNGDNVIFQHQSSGPILGNAAHEQANIVQGHEHGQFMIDYRASTQHLYWGMISGCLIDSNAMAFAYGKLFPKKPIIGCSAIIDSQPVLIPMPQDDNGRYTGKLGGVVA